QFPIRSSRKCKNAEDRTEPAMTHRRLLLLALVLLLAAGAVAFLFWSSSPPSAINRENAALIHVGQTRAEVEPVMGGPMRSETAGKVVLDDAVEAPPQELGVSKRGGDDVSAVWLSDTVQVVVYFNPDGKAVSFSVVPVRRPSWVARLV